eukprot:comp21642_c2_seq1/m.30410 comp21642_c2_seq1/g.30410  ORF comp21642_c2_seq1/g.30410 comp21642_c2_seq1/m.30410 type:complete len:332 (-) comp21642_c2_seq1:7-1002(-)
MLIVVMHKRFCTPANSCLRLDNHCFKFKQFLKCVSSQSTRRFSIKKGLSGQYSNMSFDLGYPKSFDLGYPKSLESLGNSEPNVWTGVRRVLESERTAVILLNQPLVKHFDVFWEKAHIKVCADGGANRLYDERPDQRDRYVPDCIKGDLDSVRPEVIEFYKTKNCRVVHAPSQDDHDLTKSLQHLESMKTRLHTVWILGALDGRFDHTIAAVSTLFAWRHRMLGTRLVLINNESLVMLLDTGRHRLFIEPGLEGPTCGLLPVGIRCQSVTTTGLRWNLNGDEMEMGALVSSSNQFDTNDSTHIVTVDTSDPIVWTSNIHLERLREPVTSSQ